MIDIPQDPHKAVNVLMSISRFSRLQETQQMAEWLRAERERMDGLNRKELNEAVFRQRQGVCQTLDALVKLMETADEKAANIRMNLSKGKGV